MHLIVWFQDDDDANQTGDKEVPTGGKRPVSYNILKRILKYCVFPIFYSTSFLSRNVLIDQGSDGK